MAFVNVTINPDQRGTNTSVSESEHTKYSLVKAGLGALLHPLTFSKTLYQLGFEPEKFSPNRVNLIPRHKPSHFVTNFRYFRSVLNTFDKPTLYRGAITGLAGGLAGGFATHWTEKYLDTYFKDVGGNIGDLEGKLDEDLTHHESFRVHLRHALRRSISSTIGVIAAHPFAVLMVRQIIQAIQTDQKYSRYFFCGLLKIGDEEGVSGLFSGLVSSMIGNLVCVWALFGIGFAINRILIRFEKRSTEVAEKESISSVRHYTPFLLPFVANSFAYSHQVDAVAGSVKSVHELYAKSP